MPGQKMAPGTVVDTGLLRDAEDRLIVSPTLVSGFSAAGAAAVSLQTQKDGKQFRFVQATIKFNTLPTTSEDVTLTLKSTSLGVQYDVVLARADPSTGGGTGDVVFQGEEEDVFTDSDELLLEYTNTDTRTFGARIVLEPVS